MFVTATLAAETGILYHLCAKVYMHGTIERDLNVVFSISKLVSLGNMREWFDIFHSLAWAANL